MQETTRFCLAKSNRSRYSQAIHVNTVGEGFCPLHELDGYGSWHINLGGLPPWRSCVRAGSKGSVRIRDLAVVQLPTLVLEGLQSMMKVCTIRFNPKQ